MNPTTQRKKTLMKKIVIAVIALLATAGIAAFTIDRLNVDA